MNGWRTKNSISLLKCSNKQINLVLGKMNIIKEKTFKLKNTCVTIGKFDGLHVGHQSLFKVMDKYRNEYSMTVFTFISENPKRLYSEEKKQDFLEHYGVENLIEYPFDEETKNTEPENFVKGVLVDSLDVKILVVGENFRFGKDRAGDTKFLEEMGEKYGFRVVVVPCVKYEKENVSSTMIRQMISEGKFDMVEKLLDDEFWK